MSCVECVGGSLVMCKHVIWLAMPMVCAHLLSMWSLCKVMASSQQRDNVKAAKLEVSRGTTMYGPFARW